MTSPRLGNLTSYSGRGRRNVDVDTGGDKMIALLQVGYSCTVLSVKTCVSRIARISIRRRNNEKPANVERCVRAVDSRRRTIARRRTHCYPNLRQFAVRTDRSAVRRKRNLFPRAADGRSGNDERKKTAVDLYRFLCTLHVDRVIF